MDKRSITAKINGKLGGRPKAQHTLLTEKTREYIAQKLAAHVDTILDVQIAKAEAGDLATGQFLLQFVYGREAKFQAGGGNLVINIINFDNGNNSPVRLRSNKEAISIGDSQEQGPIQSISDSSQGGQDITCRESLGDGSGQAQE